MTENRNASGFRWDGYVNLMNKWGTSQDATEAYRFQRECVTSDMELTTLYTDNGLFTKIIDTPAEEALKHGFGLGLNNPEVESFVNRSLSDLGWEEAAATALKWARLYGGSLIVMLIDDGQGLEEPVNWKGIRSIDELRVFERSVVWPDYSSLYMAGSSSEKRRKGSLFLKPQYYDISSVYGSFRVHESRCLVFRNGVVPESVGNENYRYWGMPEYTRIRRALQDVVTAHSNGPKLLERSIQAVYRMKGLASLMATEAGENQALQRLQLIDMARGMMNTIAIDSEGEDYDFKSFNFSGVVDIINSTCNMLSALTNIPQTVLFGRSPAGENATGESDLENWYSFVERIQRLNLKPNLQILLDVLFAAGKASGDIEEEPDYELKFNPLWSLSEQEQAAAEKLKADTAYVKAQTAQLYVDMQALDPSEIRAALAKSEDFEVEEILDDLPEDELFSEPSNPSTAVSVSEPQTISDEGLKASQALSAANQDSSDAMTKFLENFLYQPLTKEAISAIIKLHNFNADGGPGSGNFGHKGVPGQVGGSAPGGEASGSSEAETGKSSEVKVSQCPKTGTSESPEAKAGETSKTEAGESSEAKAGKSSRAEAGESSEASKKPSVSAQGANTPCTGFASKARLADHYGRYGAEVGASTDAEYQKKGIDFLSQPCGDGIMGYSYFSTAEQKEKIVRFCPQTTEYATGFPGEQLCTYYKAKYDHRRQVARPDIALKYYLKHKEADSGNESERSE